MRDTQRRSSAHARVGAPPFEPLPPVVAPALLAAGAGLGRPGSPVLWSERAASGRGGARTAGRAPHSRPTILRRQREARADDVGQDAGSRGRPRGAGPGHGSIQIILAGTYNQTYLIRTPDAGEDAREAKGLSDDSDDGDSDSYVERRVMFRCGNWCYTGNITLEKSSTTL